MADEKIATARHVGTGRARLTVEEVLERIKRAAKPEPAKDAPERHG